MRKSNEAAGIAVPAALLQGNEQSRPPPQSQAKKDLIDDPVPHVSTQGA
jgi:hypothetical protein